MVQPEGDYIFELEKSGVINKSRSRIALPKESPYKENIPVYTIDRFEKLKKQYLELFPPEYPNSVFYMLRYNSHLQLVCQQAEYLCQNDHVLTIVKECMEKIRYQFTDIREPGMITYPLDTLLMVILMAKAAGFETADEILKFYQQNILEFAFILPGIGSLENSLSQSTILRVLQQVEPEELQAFFEAYFTKVHFTIEKQICYHQEIIEGRSGKELMETYGFDGQELKSSFRRGEPSRKCKGASCVTLFDCTNMCVLGYTPVDKKNQEKEAIIPLLQQYEIEGKVIMADALNTVASVTDLIAQRKAFYLMPIKENGGNKELRIVTEAIFNREHSKVLKTSYVNKGHGRIEENTIEILPSNLYLDERIKNPHSNTLKTLVKRTTKTRKLCAGKEISVTENVRYYITNMLCCDLTLEQIKASIQDYWHVESHHAVLDDPRVFNQDGLQACNKNTLANTAGFNKIAHNFQSFVRQYIAHTENMKKPPSFSIVALRLRQLPAMELFTLFTDFWLNTVSNIED